MAILEEQFMSAYFRFNDDTAAVLQPFLSPAQESDSSDFLKNWDETHRRLAEYDASRLLLDFSHFLPPAAASRAEPEVPALPARTS